MIHRIEIQNMRHNQFDLDIFLQFYRFLYNAHCSNRIDLYCFDNSGSVTVPQAITIIIFRLVNKWNISYISYCIFNIVLVHYYELLNMFVNYID